MAHIIWEGRKNCRTRRHPKGGRGADATGVPDLPPYSVPLYSDLSKILAHLVHAVQHVAQHLLREMAAVGQHEAEKVGQVHGIDWLKANHGVALPLHAILQLGRDEANLRELVRRRPRVLEGSKPGGNVPETDVGALSVSGEDKGPVAIFPLENHSLNLLGESKGPVHHVGPALIAAVLPAEPDLERVGLTAALDGAVAEIRARVVLIGLEQVVSLGRVGLGQGPGLLRDEDAALQGQTQHLVRVPAERVRLLEAVEDPPSRGAQGGGAAPRAVDVHPQSVTLANIRAAVVVVIGAEHGAPRGCAHVEGHGAAFLRSEHLLLELLGDHGAVGVALHLDHVVHADAHDHRGLSERVVRLLAAKGDELHGRSPVARVRVDAIPREE
mmetsp:Transcript_3800/g.16655  ORF Transcript_3800/g.16655 Transcript_3800/m.16655 type:complete len:384 (+) Transcript_3800:183-1334(+)